MRIFVTGGTGFVGGHFIRSAIEHGHDVTALRRVGSRARIGFDLEPEWLDASLDCVGARQLRGFDGLVHFASAGVSPQRASWQDLIQWNVNAPMTLVQEAARAGIARIVAAGSFAEYGRSAHRYDAIPADAPLLPVGGYAASKAALFTCLHGYAVETRLELCYLRIFSAYGEGQHEENLWPALRRAAEEDRDFPMTLGEQVRDFIAVEDVADTFLRALVREDVCPGDPCVCNVGSGQPVTVRAFSERWWKRWKARGRLQIGALPYRPNEVMRFVPQLDDKGRAGSTAQGER